MKNAVIYTESVIPSTDNIRETLKIRKELGFDDIVFATDDPDVAGALRLITAPYRHLYVSDISAVSGRKDFTELKIDLKEDFFSHSKQVRKYLMEHSLGTMKVLESVMSEKRLKHVKAVAVLAVDIARNNGIDERKAYIAGLWHDIAKKLSDEELRYYMELYYPEYLDLAKGIWHQYVGEIILKNTYQIRDREILKAVKHHCLGDDSSPLSMVIFCADKLDPSRGYDSSAQIEVCRRDIKAGFRLVHREQEDYLRKEGVIA